MVVMVLGLCLPSAAQAASASPVLAGSTNAVPCPTDTGSTLAPELDGAPPSSSPDVPSADRRVIDIP
jgi:hypothetical protein